MIALTMAGERTPRATRFAETARTGIKAPINRGIVAKATDSGQIRFGRKRRQAPSLAATTEPAEKTAGGGRAAAQGAKSSVFL